MPRRTILMLGISAACIAIPNAVLADFYDNFDDGEYQEDPNVWDIDDPCWTVYDPLDLDPIVGVTQGWVWLYAQRILMVGSAFVTILPDSGDNDPNTSATYWAHTQSHYIMAKTFNVGAQPDPNDDLGTSVLLLHTNPATWMGYAFEYLYHKYGGGGVRPRISSVQGVDWPVLEWTRIEPDDPCHADEAGGFWMLFEYDSDGNPDADDPNGKYLRAALWNGDKFDWSGQWLFEVDLGDPCSWHEPNLVLESGDGGWRPSGITALAGEEFRMAEPCAPPDVYVAFDQIEARTGVFDPNSPRALTVKMKDCCDLTIDPDLLDDPNQDPNDLNELRRYTNGTAIVLHAVTPCGSKTFKKWVVKGPNDSGDPLYQVVSDTNQVLYLTMDGGYWVKATCKCGGGGIEPFAGMALLVLGVGAVVRRLT
jgi:hypothetical protein